MGLEEELGHTQNPLLPQVTRNPLLPQVGGGGGGQ